MKIKASWAAFVPVSVGAILLHIYFLFFIGGEEITQPLFGEYSLLINKSTEPELIAILAGVLLFFVWLFSVTDRKTASYCEIKGAPLSGLMLMLAGLLLGMDSAVNLLAAAAGSIDSSALMTSFYVFGLITALLIAIVGMGLMVGFNIAKKIRVLMLIPTIWSAVNMVKAFVGHRKEASSFSMFDMFVWVSLTLFLFYNAMVLCGVEIKNPVKSSFMWGTELVLYSAIYAMSEINDSINALGSFDVISLVPQLMICAFALYALFFLFKLSSSMITKEQEEELEDEEDTGVKKTDEADEPEAAFGVGSTKYVTAEFEKIRMEKAAKKARENVEEDDDDEDDISTLDKIDQLIQELSDEGQTNKSKKK
ncbi:MAG: hypothetical protein IIZ59_04120 [Clostridia bacterium]|nr:hypothetical protein [Clostridia bacterium]